MNSALKPMGVRSTEYPIGRKPKLTNTPKDGGVCFEERKDDALAAAIYILVNSPARIPKRKDEVKQAMYWFWKCFAVAAIIELAYLAAKGIRSWN